MNSSSRRPGSSPKSAEAKPTVSNPSSAAILRSSSRSGALLAPSEVEVGIMRRRRHTRQIVRQNGTEARPGFGAGVPDFRGRMLLPRDIAKIVDAGELGRRRNVGKGEIIARKPRAALHQIGDIFEMIMNVVMARADRCRVRRAAPGQPLHDLLFDQVF